MKEWEVVKTRENYRSESEGRKWQVWKVSGNEGTGSRRVRGR